MPGRHREPTPPTARRIAVIAALLACLALASNTASAAPQLDWSQVRDALAHCESGNRPTAQNPRSTASGTWQLLDSTWRSMGGTRYATRAKYATPAEQELIAKRLYLRSGLTPWNASRACWRHRIGKTTTKPTPTPTVPAPQPGRPYVVVDGDTLSDIAARTGHTWQDLLEHNRAVITDPDRIHVGLTINLL